MNGRNEKLFNLLTICRRAGRMTFGFDSSKEAIQTKKASIVLLASDISAKTEKEIRFFSDKSGINVIKTDASIDEFEFGIGKRVGVIAVCDNGFAKRTAEILNCEV